MNKITYLMVLMAVVVGSLSVVKGQNEAVTIEDLDKIEITQGGLESAEESVTIVQDDANGDTVELVTSDDEEKDEADTSEPIMTEEQQLTEETNAKSIEVDDLVTQLEQDQNQDNEPPTEIVAEPETPELVKKAAAVVERPIDSSSSQGDDADNTPPIGEINSDAEEPKQSENDVVYQVSEKQVNSVDYDDSESNLETEAKNLDDKVDESTPAAAAAAETTTTTTPTTTTIASEEKQEPILKVEEQPKLETIPVEEIEHTVPDTNNTDAESNSNLKSPVDTDKNPLNNETLIDDHHAKESQPEPQKPDTDNINKQPVNSNSSPDSDDKKKNTRPAGVNAFFIIIPVVCGAAVVLIVAAMILYRRTSLFRSEDEDDDGGHRVKREIYKKVPGQENELHPEAQKLNA